MNKIDLAARCAVITGAASGIGYAIAERLLGSGATVILWDRDRTAAQKAAANLGNAGVIEVDVSDHSSVRSAVAATTKITPHIDILVNSAGITGPNAVTWEYPVEAWSDVIDVNLNGTFFCLKEVVPLMQERDYGRVVNIASVAGKEGNPNASAYSASKAGIIALTKSIAKELAKTNVRVNCVTPAAVQTPLFSQMKQEHIDYMLSKIPLGRFGHPGEIAAMVAWLCSEECSFATGAAFDLSGGRSTY